MCLRGSEDELAAHIADGLCDLQPAADGVDPFVLRAVASPHRSPQHPRATRFARDAKYDAVTGERQAVPPGGSGGVDVEQGALTIDGDATTRLHHLS